MIDMKSSTSSPIVFTNMPTATNSGVVQLNDSIEYISDHRVLRGEVQFKVHWRGTSSVEDEVSTCIHEYVFLDV
jgi:hypothetical protein